MKTYSTFKILILCNELKEHRNTWLSRNSSVTKRSQYFQTWEQASIGIKLAPWLIFDNSCLEKWSTNTSENWKSTRSLQFDITERKQSVTPRNTMQNTWWLPIQIVNNHNLSATNFARRVRTLLQINAFLAPCIKLTPWLSSYYIHKADYPQTHRNSTAHLWTFWGWQHDLAWLKTQLGLQAVTKACWRTKQIDSEQHQKHSRAAMASPKPFLWGMLATYFWLLVIHSVSTPTTSLIWLPPAYLSRSWAARTKWSGIGSIELCEACMLSYSVSLFLLQTETFQKGTNQELLKPSHVQDVLICYFCYSRREDSTAEWKRTERADRTIILMQNIWTRLH